MTRGPQPLSKVPFKFLKPLKLSSNVKGKIPDRLSGICFNEFSSLLLCLKSSGFNEQVCSKEISGFQKCYNTHVKRKYSKDSSFSSKRTPEEINKLLQRFPDVKIR